MQIAFWSPNHGQTGTTTAALTFASMLAVTHNFKVLLTHSQFERSTLEQCLIKTNHLRNEELAFFSDHGLSALRRLAKNGRLNNGMISDYTTSLLPNKNLDLLEGVLDGAGIDSEEEAILLRKIFGMANSDYDLVFVDIHSGLNMKLSRELIEDSDIVVVCLNQNTLLIDRFMENEAKQQVLEGKRIVYNIGFYDPTSKYTLKNLKRMYAMNNTIIVPRHTPLMDAGNASQSLDYILRMIDVSQKDKNYPFVKTLKEGCEKLMAMTDAIEQEVFEKHA